MNEPIVKALEPLGIEWTPEPGDMITDALVIARVSNTSGQTQVLLQTQRGMDVVTRLGLIEAARSIEQQSPWGQLDD